MTSPLMKAADVMTRDVATISPLMQIGAAARFLTERHISGAPVVDGKGNLVGVVSQTDLTRFQGSAHGDDPFGAEDETSRAETPVVAVMTDRPITCEEDTTVEELARIMLERRVHRVLITRQGKLRGIVSAMDLLRCRAGA